MCSLLLLQVTLQRLHTLTTRNDDADSMIVDFLLDGLLDFSHILRQGNHHLQMLFADTQATTDSLELVGTSRVLTARHSGGKVVGDDNCDVGILVDGIQQTRHTRMRKR